MLNVRCFLLKYITQPLFGRPYWIYANYGSIFSVFYHLIKLGSEVQNKFIKLFIMANAGLII